MSIESLLALFRRKPYAPPMTEFEKMREALRPVKVAAPATAPVPATPPQAESRGPALTD